MIRNEVHNGRTRGDQPLQLALPNTGSGSTSVATGVSRRTILRIETEQRDVQAEKVAVMRAFAAASGRYLDEGHRAGASCRRPDDYAARPTRRTLTLPHSGQRMGPTGS